MSDVVDAALASSIDPILPLGLRAQTIQAVSEQASADPELCRQLAELQRLTQLTAPAADCAGLDQRAGQGNGPGSQAGRGRQQ